MLKDLFKDRKVVIFDIKTTEEGMDSEILYFAARVYVNNEMESKHNFFIATDKKLNGRIIRKYRITNKKIESEGIDARVINIHTIKPIDKDIIIEAAKETGSVVTVEEHSVIGGLGSAVCDVLAESYPVKVTKIGVNDVFGHSGPAVDLLKEFGLCADNIVDTVKKTLEK